mgnify:CR=1 FL=1
MSKEYEIVDSVERLKETIDRVKKAQEEFAKFTQEGLFPVLLIYRRYI